MEEIKNKIEIKTSNYKLSQEKEGIESYNLQIGIKL